MTHKHTYKWSNLCGVGICPTCSDHELMDRCYCGWASDGGDGLAQLMDMGESAQSITAHIRQAEGVKDDTDPEC